MATYRALMLGAHSPLAPAVSRALEHAQIVLRLAHPWGKPGGFESAPPHIERVILDPLDPTSLQDALRACNFIIRLDEPSESLARDVQEARALARAIRDSDVERPLLVSCASMLGAGEPSWLKGPDRGYTFGRGSEIMDHRYMLELEWLRFTADALDVIRLYPGYCVDPDAPLPLPPLASELSPDHPVNAVSTREVARAALAALQHGRAGAAYAIGGVNTSIQELAALLGVQAAHRLPWLGQSKSEHPRFRDALLGAGHLESASAWKSLGVARPIADLEMLLESAAPE